MTRLGLLTLCASVLVWAGCGDDQILAGGDTGQGDDVGAGDGGGDDTTTTDTSGDTATTDTAGEDVSTGPTFEELFVECAAESECEDNEACHQGVCVKDPISDVELYEEEGNSYVLLDDEPNFDCWETPFSFEADEPAETTISGNVDLFGPESPTRNLCVTAYDEALFLHWMVWLDQNRCGELKDVDPRDQEPYVDCFALDPCRCEDEEFTQYHEGATDGLEQCYAEIGYCAAITDSGLQQTCRENIEARTGMAADTMIFGSVQSEAYEPNPDRTEGVYTMEGVPTNSRMVVKVSGRQSRWRDTYEFGAFVRAERVNAEGVARWDSNVITDGAWRTIPSSAGVPDPIGPDAAAVAGVVRDCGVQSENPEEARGPDIVSGARVGFVLDPVTIAYFNGVADDTLPQPGQAYTNKDGVYAAISVPAGPNRVGALVRVDGENVNAGLRDVFVPPFSVAISTFEGNWE